MSKTFQSNLIKDRLKKVIDLKDFCYCILPFPHMVSEGGSPSTCEQSENFFGRKMIHQPRVILREQDASSHEHIVQWESRRREKRGVDRSLELQLNEIPSAVGMTVLQSSRRYKCLYRFLSCSLRAVDA